MLYALLLVALLGEAQAVEVKDATGKTFITAKSADTAPRRIVTLAPSLAELAASLFETDLERIVGVSEATDEPAALLKKPTIGPFHHPSLERIVALRPDLVLATLDGNPKAEIDRLRSMGIPVFVAASGNFKQIRDSIFSVAQILGREEKGGILLDQLDRTVAGVKERAKARVARDQKLGKPRRRIVLQIGVDPIVVVGPQTFLGEALDFLQVENVFSDAKTTYPKPGWEELVRRDPDQVLILLMGIPKERADRAFRLWERFPKLKAVSGKSLTAIRSDALLRPAVRYSDGLLALERALK